MKKLAFLVALFGFAAFAGDKYKFTLASTSPTADISNTSTEVLTAGGTYAVQCDAAAHIKTSTGGTAATTNDVKLAVDQLYDVDLLGGEVRISALAVSGTANCRVFQVNKRSN